MINVSDTASNKLQNLFLEENRDPKNTYVKVGVMSGGCSGLSYDLDFTSGEENDTIFDYDGYKIFMDAKSMIYLKGMSLDFQDGLQGKGFQFINPNATSTCGCGESFSMS